MAILIAATHVASHETGEGHRLMGVVLVLWSRDKFGADMGIKDIGRDWGGAMFAHNRASPEVRHQPGHCPLRRTHRGITQLSHCG